MKKFKLILLTVLIILSSLLIAKTISAQIDLPVITTVCEHKTGGLFAFDDGFSNHGKCPSKTRRVVLIGEEGFTPEKIIHVCFNVATADLTVMKNGTCFPHVEWKIPVQCVEGKPCVPDNPDDSFYIPPQLEE